MSGSAMPPISPGEHDMRRHFLKEIFHMTYEDLRQDYIRLGTIERVATHFRSEMLCCFANGFVIGRYNHLGN